MNENKQPYFLSDRNSSKVNTLLGTFYKCKILNRSKQCENCFGLLCN